MAFGERMNRKHAERKRERSAERRWQKQLENQPQDDSATTTTASATHR